ncbi:hypothetical protein K6V98_01925 [Collinsella sp. AGMB00827]|uniref:Bacterial transcriptional activator domain-containing protein n=1 Tax=Collinsella ureilytica TaxID=2869515 RepID=A0ABS7MJC0_9ACTN|nr:BTAD domain-containing putative transcriptional regulator [Collinsella urealyticum]MBY4797123.1 hypothetical protein [Collinsella urealyticum]
MAEFDEASEQGWMVERPFSSDMGSFVDEPMGAAMFVDRARIVRRLIEAATSAGIAFVCAPKGFGKTAILLQCAASIRTSSTTYSGKPARSVALIGGASLSAPDLFERMEQARMDCEHPEGAVLLIDGVPACTDSEAEQFIRRMRTYREHSMTIIVACTPPARPIINAVGDSYKMSAATLKVQPAEYAKWAKALVISPTLDVYQLTLGIPALVSALGSLAAGEGGDEHLDCAVADLYSEVLAEVARIGGSLSRLMPLLILLEAGRIADLERVGMRVAGPVLRRLIREYPVFHFDEDDQSFSCLGTHAGVPMRVLRSTICADHPELLTKAIRIHLSANRVDAAIELMEQSCTADQILEMVGSYPVAFTLAGRSSFVRTAVAILDAEAAAQIDVGVIAALYLSSLSSGDYRLARSAARMLCRRASEIEESIDPKDWACVLAARQLWASCTGIDLPELSGDYLRHAIDDRARLLLEHARSERELLAQGSADVRDVPALSAAQITGQAQLNLIDVLSALDGLVQTSIVAGELAIRDDDRLLSDLTRVLTTRKLAPIAARARAVASLRRLFAGMPVVDERAFCDMITVAVRESDLEMQLFFMVADGWQSLAVNQLVNGRFRAQQVLRLAASEHSFIRRWAELLERTAIVLNSSRVTLREEAESLNLSHLADDPAEAWCVALQLSAARFDSDLSAWFSLNRATLLDEGFRPVVRLALALAAARSAALRRLIPTDLAASYLFQTDEETGGSLPSGANIDLVSGIVEIGQLEIKLFGGFQISRNGHHLTSRIWHRKKAGILAARLTLSLGAFVGRHVLSQELWPSADMRHARQSLYTATSALRAALGQVKGGPQYLLTQGEGMALNTNYVYSDTAEFDVLAREILLQRTGSTPRPVLDACLKLEQLYQAPLYVPGTADITFFTRMRDSYASRFADCMVRGMELAFEDEDLVVASWLAEAAFKLAPRREDVLRWVMRILSETGRKREVVDLYSAHLQYLERDLHHEPDRETVRVYEQVMSSGGLRAFQ